MIILFNALFRALLLRRQVGTTVIHQAVHFLKMAVQIVSARGFKIRYY